MKNLQNIKPERRLLSAILDHIIMTFVIGIFAIPYITYHMIHINKLYLDAHQFEQKVLLYTMYLGLALYYCKDCIQGQSFAKRILKLQIINCKTGEVASSLRCFVRDIFIILFPIEGMMILINPSRRLGDYIAGTKIIPVDCGVLEKKNNIIQLCCSFLLAYSFVFVLSTLTDGI